MEWNAASPEPGPEIDLGSSILGPCQISRSRFMELPLSQERQETRRILRRSEVIHFF